MRIKQVCVSGGIRDFKKRIFRKYSFVEYSDPNQPAVFFGCYQGRDITRIKNHHSLAVLVWRGTDAARARRPKCKAAYLELLLRKNVKHIAISDFIVEDLRDIGVSFKFLPICHVDHRKFSPVKPGSKVYVYNYDHPKRGEMYGRSIVDRVMSKLPNFEILSTQFGKFSFDEMPKIYEQTFIGLRFTSHDGLPNSVIEPGLMGIRCVYNKNLPSAIYWETEDDIVKAILEESKRIGITNEKVAKQTLDYITISDDWLYTEYYEGY